MKQPTDKLEKALAKQLPKLGHRNWIVVADAAYPLQSAAGIKTIRTKRKHVKALRCVLEAIAEAGH
ncbi:MAG TPA: RbsD/FucU domain-containing protein, partial [Planctomycetota bacterium]